MARRYAVPRTSLVCLAAFALLLLVVLSSSRRGLPRTTSPFFLPSVATPSTAGSWVDSSLGRLTSFSSVDPISSKYGLRSPGQCFVPHPLGLSEEAHVDLEQQRFREVGKWEWQPSSGRELRAWNVEAVLSRLVNSPRGMIFIGDSITQQQHAAFLLSLRSSTPLPPLLITERFNEAPMNKTSREISILNPGHPLIESLRTTLSFVPVSRWARPVVSFYRHDLLIGEDSFRKLLEKEDIVKKNEKWQPSETTAADNFWVAWEGKEARGWKKMERDIVSINSGSHWSERALGVGQNFVPKAFNAMVASLLPRFLSLPNTLLVIRSTSTPHLNCETYASPGLPRDDGTEDPQPTWGWNTFEELDVIWEEALDGKTGPVWMNVTEMSRSRPDAHSNKIFGRATTDCLHWCAPIIPHWWNRVLWDLIGSSS